MAEGGEGWRRGLSQGSSAQPGYADTGMSLHSGH